MQAPPADAQASVTPFNDAVDLGVAIGRAKGLNAANAEVAGRISLGIFFAETNGKQNIGNARSDTYKGSLQTGVPEDRNGQRRWAGFKNAIAAFDPVLVARDDKEEALIGTLDHRLNHWTAVRDGIMNAHADVFPQIPATVQALPRFIDQMKLFGTHPNYSQPYEISVTFQRPAQLSSIGAQNNWIFAKQQHLRIW